MQDQGGALVDALVAQGPGEVGEEGGFSQIWLGLGQLEPARQQGALAGGVDGDGGLDLADGPAGLAEAHARCPLSIEEHVEDGMAP